MPLHQCQILPSEAIWATWRLTEDLPQLWALLAPTEIDTFFLRTISHPERLRASLAARLCVKHIVENHWAKSYKGLQKDAHDAPSLLGEQSFVSIAHTQGFAAAILHPRQAVGIDIEPERQKIHKVAPKFLHPQEQTFAYQNTATLTIIWTIKEALYKLQGRKKLSFAQDMCILPFEVPLNSSPMLALTTQLFLPTATQNYTFYCLPIAPAVWLSYGI